VAVEEESVVNQETTIVVSSLSRPVQRHANLLYVLLVIVLLEVVMVVIMKVKGGVVITILENVKK